MITASSRKRARVCVCVSVSSSRHRCSSQSKSWHWGVPTARWTWLLGRRCSSWRQMLSALLATYWLPRNTNNEAFVFEPAFVLLNTKKHKNQAPKAIVSTYRKHSTTAFNRSCTEQQSTYSSTFMSTRVRQRKQVGMNEQARCCWDEPCANKYEVWEVFIFLCFFFSSIDALLIRKQPTTINLVIFFSADTQPCDGPQTTNTN